MRTAAQTTRVFGLGDIQIRVCAQCGKRFAILTPAYAYKMEKRKGDKAYSWFCSYSCMRAVQKPLEEKEKAEFDERVRRDILNLDTLEAYRAAQEKKKLEKRFDEIEKQIETKTRSDPDREALEKDREIVGAMLERMKKRDKEQRQKAKT